MRKPHSAPTVDFEHFDFSISARPAVTMTRAHRHNDLEMVVVEQGSVTWLFGGAKVEVSEDQLAVRWAAVPHQCIGVVGQARHISLKLPLAWMLSWQLPQPFVEQIFQGEHFIDLPQKDGISDVQLMRRWLHDLKTGGHARQHILLLEVEARLWRLAISNAAQKASMGPARHSITRPALLGKVERMAAFIAQHYTEPLPMTDIAASVGLNPRYAMSLFQKTFGMTMLDFVTHFRVWHAQRLLAAGDAKILQIAYDAGFGSASRFYAAFEAIVGHSPKAYRRIVQQDTPPRPSDERV